MHIDNDTLAIDPPQWLIDLCGDALAELRNALHTAPLVDTLLEVLRKAVNTAYDEGYDDGYAAKGGTDVDLLGINFDALTWTKARRSGDSNCLEVARTHKGIAVRNSREPKGSVLLLTESEWSAFLGGARDGDFDALLGESD